MSAICAGCPAILPPNKAPGRARKWCSDRCRKQTTYVRCCEDCGARLSGSDGNGPNAPRWCVTCAVPHVADANRIWTRAAILLAIEEWVAEHGEPPAVMDWNPWGAQHELHDEQRAARWLRDNAAGKYPSFKTVVNRFGSWNAAIEAAGFTPRAAHGGDGNENRKRSLRARMAA